MSLEVYGGMRKWLQVLFLHSWEQRCFINGMIMLEAPFFSIHRVCVGIRASAGPSLLDDAVGAVLFFLLCRLGRFLRQSNGSIKESSL